MRAYEYNKEDKLIWESYTATNQENNIRTITYFYNKEGLLEKVEEENLEDKNKKTIYKYDYTENDILESITFKLDTSDVEIIYQEDENKALITGYDIAGDRKKKSYTTFYTKNSDSQFVEYKFISEKYGGTNCHNIYTYTNNKLLDQINGSYTQKERTYKSIFKFKYKNKKQIKNLDTNAIERVNKKIIEINSSGQNIWSLVKI